MATSSGLDEAGNDLVEHLVGERSDLVAGERLDGVLDHDGLVAHGPQRRGLRAGGLGELGGDHRRRGHSVVFEKHAVVHTARCAGPSVGKRLDHSVARLEDLRSQVLGRRPRERRLLLADDGLGIGTLSQELLDAIQEVVTLGLGDVEERDRLAVEGGKARSGFAGHCDGVGRIQELFCAHRPSRGDCTFLMMSLDILGKVQPGMTAVKRPAVPPATRNLRLAGSRNLGMSVMSVSGCGNFFITWAGNPSPPSCPGMSALTGLRRRCQRNSRMAGFVQPSPAIMRACSGENTSSVSPWWVDLWCEMTSSECEMVMSRSSARVLLWS